MPTAESVDPIDITIGARIRMRRMQLGLSQAALGEHLGVTFQQVQKYERGANRISASMLLRAARALHCPTGALLEGSETAGAQEDNLEAELAAMLAQPGAVDMLRAFAQIPSGEARSGILAVAKSLARDPASAVR